MTSEVKRIDLESMQPGLAELERAAVWCIKKADLIDITGKVVIAIQTRGKKAKCRGWMKKNSWSTREGELCNEMTITSEGLNRDPVDIIGTVIHECIHLIALTDDVQDVSKVGRHNKHFKEYAEILGLECAKPSDSYGWGYTTVSEELRKDIINSFKPDVAAFNVFCLVPEPSEPTNKNKAWSCACDKPIKVRTTREDVALHCRTCDKDLAIQEV